MVHCEPHEILWTVNVVHFRHIYELLLILIGHITQFFLGIQSVPK